MDHFGTSGHRAPETAFATALAPATASAMRAGCVDDVRTLAGLAENIDSRVSRLSGPIR